MDRVTVNEFIASVGNGFCVRSKGLQPTLHQASPLTRKHIVIIEDKAAQHTLGRWHFYT